MNTQINAIDMIDLQWMAARYAHERRTFSPHTVNTITVKMIQDGVMPMADTTRDAPEPTVWVRDGDFGWPMDLVEKYGWDGRKTENQ
jgi:hypothetical protein